MNGKFSIILPYFNGEAYIREAVESVLAQSNENWELILVDDGSSDKRQTEALRRMVQGWNDPRIHHHWIPNHGLADARNWAIRQSTGQFIAFLDQDDVWAPDKLLIQAGLFQNGEIHLICTDADYIGEKSGPMDISSKWGFFREGFVDDSFGMLMKGNFVACSTVAVRRECLEMAGWSNRAFTVVPDYEYWLRFATITDFYFIPESLASYRIHDSNTSRQVVRGECEVLSILFSKQPRHLKHRLNLAFHALRSLLTIGGYWLQKLVAGPATTLNAKCSMTNGVQTENHVGTY